MAISTMMAARKARTSFFHPFPLSSPPLTFDGTEGILYIIAVEATLKDYYP
jgi:hypothetical protein